MLEVVERALSAFRWDTLRTNHGRADKVPEAIRGILSPDANVRRASYWQLDNHVVLQGDLSDSAYATASVFLGVLQAGATNGKGEIYELLTEILLGAAPPQEMITDQSGRRRSLENACHELVCSGHDVYRKDALSPEPMIAQKAAELLEIVADHLVEGGLPTIAILEDDPRRISVIREAAWKMCPEVANVRSFNSAPELVAWLEENLPRVRLLSLDCDLDSRTAANECGSGEDVAAYLCRNRPSCPVLIHSSNALRAPAMHLNLTLAGVQAHLCPFTTADQWANDARRALAQSHSDH